MFYDDHNPPHFHAKYTGEAALFDIQDACILKGTLPARQLIFVLAWAELHKDELMQNWELAKEGQPQRHDVSCICSAVRQNSGTKR